MRNFWRFARKMLTYRATVIGSVVAILVSALCFGAGVMSIPLVLGAMLGGGDVNADTDLHVIISRVNADRLNAMIPAHWISLLPHDVFTGVVLVLGSVLVLSVVGATAKYLHSYLALSAAYRTIANIRKAAFYRAIHLPMRTVVAEGTMDKISRIIRDTNQLSRGFTAITSKAVSESLKGIVGLTVALFWDWKLTLLALALTPPLAFTIRHFSEVIKKASHSALVQSGRLLAAITQSIQGIRVVKVHTAERWEVGRFNRVNKRLLAEEMSMRQARALASPIVEMLTSMAIAVVAGLAAWHIIRNQGDFTSALAALAGLGIAGASLRPLTQLSTDLYEAAAAADRLASLMAVPVEKSRGDHRRRLPPHARSIVFDNVRLTYPAADRPALDGVSLTIPHGSTYAFVGPNGSGKTSLLALIPRLFEPESGRVLIDGIDLREVSVKSLRQQIGVVTQETVLFNDSISRNIAYGAGAADTEEIVAAALGAFADEFIRERPQGYDTIVGEQGVTLSGGQKQRLAIARAILRQPRILILDEATSMIDADSEAQIAASLREFCAHRTSLVIAHRLSTVINADRIIVMDDGKIVDTGTHAELLDRCDLYRTLCRTQLTSDAGISSNSNGTGTGNCGSPPSVVIAKSPIATAHR